MKEEIKDQESTLESSTLLNCLRCGHTWSPRSNTKPKSCPRCGSYYYDQPYKRNMSTEAKLAVLQSDTQLKINRQLLTRIEALEQRVAQLEAPQEEK